MDFTPFIETLPDEGVNAIVLYTIVLGIFLVIGGCVALVFLGAKIFESIDNRKADIKKPFSKRKTIITGLIATVFAGLYTLAIVAVVNIENERNANNEKINANFAIAEENLKTKYEIEDVLWRSYDSRVTDPKTEIPRQLLVQDSKGQQIIFQYKANPETGEPFLLTMPFKSGAPLQGVIPDDILRK